MVTPIYAEIHGHVDIYDFFRILVKNDEVLWKSKNSRKIEMYYKNMRFNLVYTKSENNMSVLELVILDDNYEYMDICNLFNDMCKHPDVNKFIKIIKQNTPLHI